MNVVSTSFKLVDEMMQSAYLCIILHDITIYRGFNPISNYW